MVKKYSNFVGVPIKLNGEVSLVRPVFRIDRLSGSTTQFPPSPSFFPPELARIVWNAHTVIEFVHAWRQPFLFTQYIEISIKQQLEGGERERLWLKCG